MSESFDSLRQKLLELVTSARASIPPHRRAFWAHRPLEDFPPKSIRIPEEFTGGDHIAIACTQTELGAKAQRELVDRWCRVLPTLSVRFAWLLTKTPQDLFEAACSIPTLEGLYVSWSSIADLAPLAGARRLRYLKIGSCPSVTEMSVFDSLQDLRCLELGLPHSVSDLEWLRPLKKLEDLSLVGEEGKPRKLKSLQPLSELVGLRRLHLGAIRCENDSLRPLAALSSLQYLAMANRFPMAEFAWLSRRLPNTDCDRFKPGHLLAGIGCKRCKSGRVMISGKGATTICPSCDARKWEKYVEAFIAAALADPD